MNEKKEREYTVEYIPKIEDEKSKLISNPFTAMVFNRATKPLMKARKSQIETEDLGALHERFNIEINQKGRLRKIPCSFYTLPAVQWPVAQGRP